jgi:uncharacterized membrane protein
MLKALVVLVVLVCEWQVHAVLARSADGVQGAAAALMIVPLLAIAALAAMRMGNKLAWAAGVVAAATLTWLLLQYGRAGLAVFYGVPHALIYVGLGWMFGRTLRTGRVPLITMLARRVHGALPPHMEIYTRRITLAWCVFCIAQVAVSLLLLLFSPMEMWSMFVNRLNLPLLAAMFVGEYGWRMLRHRDFPHASIATAVGAFMKHAGTKGSP